MERTHSQIDMDELRKIARWKTAGISVTEIAEKLGRHRSFRELRRNAFEDPVMDDLNGYDCVTAHEMRATAAQSCASLPGSPSCVSQSSTRSCVAGLHSKLPADCSSRVRNIAPAMRRSINSPIQQTARR